MTYINACLFILFVLLLIPCWFIHLFLTYGFTNLMWDLSSYMWSNTPESANVSSSHNRIRGPCVSYWFPDRSNCSYWSFKAAVPPINLPGALTNVNLNGLLLCNCTGCYTIIQHKSPTYGFHLLPYKMLTWQRCVLSSYHIYPQAEEFVLCMCVDIHITLNSFIKPYEFTSISSCINK